MAFLAAYQNVLLTILAVSTTGLFVLRYLEWREYRRLRDRDGQAEPTDNSN